MKSNEMKKYVIVSGFFNPLHEGHLKMFEEAKKLGKHLIVIVNNDKQQLLKKGKIIMSELERLRIIKALKMVDTARLAFDEDGTVVNTLEYYGKVFKGSGLVFANGGDRKDKETVPETKICEEYKIEMVFGVGGFEKTNSSSNINKLRGAE